MSDHPSPLLRSSNSEIGFSSISRLRFCNRVKPFRLFDALSYSYSRDMRFVLFICALLGIVIWWHIAPTQLFQHPASLCSPYLSTLVRICKDTFVAHVCSIHPDVASPFSCGEPLNVVARQLIPDSASSPVSEPSFDPLSIRSRTKSACLIIGFLVVTVMLSESVSPHGFYVGGLLIRLWRTARRFHLCLPARDMH